VEVRSISRITLRGSTVTESQSIRPSTSPYKPLRGVFIIILSVTAVTVVSKLFRPKEIVPWRSDFAAAREESRATSRPVLAYFTADWCPPCQTMKHSTWADKRVELALRDFVPVKIDVDTQRDLAIRYGIEGPPFIAILDDEARIRRFVGGYINEEDFLIWIGATTPTTAPIMPQLETR
jgi:thiol-disulfide isomerase/thioredoxin